MLLSSLEQLHTLVRTSVGFATASTASPARSSGHLGFATHAWGAQHPNSQRWRLTRRFIVGRRGGTFKTFLAEQSGLGLRSRKFHFARGNDRPWFGWCDPLRVLNRKVKGL